MEASLAAYKVFGIIEDECRINEYSYDTMVKGDNERLVDMDILVNATDEYIENTFGSTRGPQLHTMKSRWRA